MQKLWRAVISLSFGQSCWNCIFELPRSRAFLQCTTRPSVVKKSGSSQLFGVLLSQAGQTTFGPELSKAVSFLCCILVKLHIRTQLNDSFPTTYGSWRGTKENFDFHQFTSYANWRGTKGCFHHFERLYSFEQGTVRYLHMGFWGRQNLETVGPSV